VEELEGALGPPLWAYEMERVVGVAPGNDDFQQSVRPLFGPRAPPVAAVFDR
jgi:hypothetical protein